MISRVLHNPMNGRFAATSLNTYKYCGVGFSYEDAETQKDSNHWSASENNRNNAWNVNFNTGNVNNNNKYNTNVVRPVTASLGYMPDDFTSSVWDAYEDCLKGKRRSSQALEYMSIARRDIPKLAWELWSGTYQPVTSTCFLVKYPKLREVFAASFRDRIAHHWVCLRLNPLFEERFESQGNVSFNCRKGFGTQKAVQYVAEGMKRISDNYRTPAWVFRGDLVGFFMSINKDKLWYRLERFAKRKYYGEYKSILIDTVKKIVMHRPEKNCVLNSPCEWWEHLAQNKSLFTTDTGMPIGNLTTQLFANFYMSYFITYVKWIYRHKNYIIAQFVDDFIIVCDDLRFLTESIDKIDAFLDKVMGLKLHKDKRYLQPVSHGIMFVGTVIKPNREYLSNRTLARMEERCVGFRKLMESKENFNEADCERIERVLNSYFGFCSGHRTYNKRIRLIESMGAVFWKYFYIKGHIQSVRVRKKNRLINNLFLS